jgi:hypothetical protein
VSPAPSAQDHEKEFEHQPFACVRFFPAATELTRDAEPAPDGPVDDAASTAAEIQAIFRSRIAGLRRLPKRERALALRVALEWLWFAEAALREKRMIERSAHYEQDRRHRLRRLQPLRYRDLDRR